MDDSADTAALPLRLQDLLLQHPDLEEFLSALAVLVAGHLGGWDVAGTSLLIVRPRRQPAQAGSAERFVALQGGSRGDDPAGVVLAGGGSAVVRDLGTENRWFGFRSAAREQDVAAVAAVPVPGLEPSAAVLTCYSSRPGAFGPEAVRGVERAAADLAAPLALALRLDAQAHRAHNLQAALESRTVVDLAAGIIMGQNNCSQQRAVEILRSVSNSRNVKVREVAAGVVAVVSDRVSTHFEE